LGDGEDPVPFPWRIDLPYDDEPRETAYLQWRMWRGLHSDPRYPKASRKLIKGTQLDPAEAVQRANANVSVKQGVEFLNDSQNQILWMPKEAVDALHAPHDFMSPNQSFAEHRIEQRHEHDKMAESGQIRPVRRASTAREDHCDTDSNVFSLQDSTASSPGVPVTASPDYYADDDMDMTLSITSPQAYGESDLEDMLRREHTKRRADPSRADAGWSKRSRNDDHVDIFEDASGAAHAVLDGANTKLGKRKSQREHQSTQEPARKKHRSEFSDKENEGA
jgi:hypothetical protein